MLHVLGLGNPGERYVGTRHNVGRDFLYDLQKEEGWPAWEKDKHANALRTQGLLDQQPLVALLPETFMNASGITARYVIEKEAVAPAEVVIVYDDIDLEFGRIRVSKGRGSGGHNGIESIISSLGSKDFIRIRIGIAKKNFWTGKLSRPTGVVMNKFVLGAFTGSEQKDLSAIYVKCRDALKLLAVEGIEKTMNECN